MFEEGSLFNTGTPPIFGGEHLKSGRGAIVSEMRKACAPGGQTPRATTGLAGGGEDDGVHEFVGKCAPDRIAV